MGGNIPGGSFPDNNIFATSKNFLVKSLLSSILKEYIYISFVKSLNLHLTSQNQYRNFFK